MAAGVAVPLALLLAGVVAFCVIRSRGGGRATQKDTGDAVFGDGEYGEELLAAPGGDGAAHAALVATDPLWAPERGQTNQDLVDGFLDDEI